MNCGLKRGPMAVQNDTHAADTAEDVAVLGGGAFGGAEAIAFSRGSTNIGTTETTVKSQAITPLTAANSVFIAGYVGVNKATNAGTLTGRLKNGTTVLFSVTTSSISANDFNSVFLTAVERDVPLSAQTYNITAQLSTDGGSWFDGECKAQVEKAVLTGGPGTCP